MAVTHFVIPDPSIKDGRIGNPSLDEERFWTSQNDNIKELK